jgi:heat shock protein beta
MKENFRNYSKIWNLALLPNFSANASEEDEAIGEEPTVKQPKTPATKGTDDQTVQREEEAIKLEGLSVAEIKKIRESAEKHQFQAEVFWIEKSL